MKGVKGGRRESRGEEGGGRERETNLGVFLPPIFPYFFEAAVFLER
jgi:hypothetical protein